MTIRPETDLRTKKNEHRNRASIRFLEIVQGVSLATLMTLWRNHSTPDAALWKVRALERAFARKGLPVPE